MKARRAAMDAELAHVREDIQTSTRRLTQLSADTDSQGNPVPPAGGAAGRSAHAPAPAAEAPRIEKKDSLEPAPVSPPEQRRSSLQDARKPGSLKHFETLETDSDNDPVTPLHEV